jgi:hypothetical protein
MAEERAREIHDRLAEEQRQWDAEQRRQEEAREAERKEQNRRAREQEEARRQEEYRRWLAQDQRNRDWDNELWRNKGLQQEVGRLHALSGCDCCHPTNFPAQAKCLGGSAMLEVTS